MSTITFPMNDVVTGTRNGAVFRFAKLSIDWAIKDTGAIVDGSQAAKMRIQQFVTRTQTQHVIV